MANVPPEKIAYVDETGIDTYLCRQYGYAQKGKLVRARIPGRKYARTGIVAAKLGDKIIAARKYKGTVNHELFEDWFENMLLPALPKDTVTVTDNASFHRKKQLKQIAKAHGYRPVFLPPYSPELNPIEHFWAWLKRFLRKILPDHNSFDEALQAAFSFRDSLLSS